MSIPTAIKSRSPGRCAQPVMTYPKRGQAYLCAKQLFNYFFALVWFVDFIQCYQPHFYYAGKCEYKDVTSFIQSQGRCKFNPYQESGISKEKTKEKTPCTILLKDKLSGVEWLNANHQIQSYDHGAKYNFNLTIEQCNSTGYKESEMIILFERETATKRLYEECERNDQCNGTQNAGICRQVHNRKLCWCNTGYVANPDSLKCRKANKNVHEECELNEQCTVTNNGNTCQKMHQNTTGTCICNDQYVFINGKCLKTGRHVNETCEKQVQCNGTLNAGVCKKSVGHSVCTCDQGYLEVIGECVKEGRRLGESCQVNLQCNGTEKAGLCGENYTCTCNEGFIREREDCLPDKRQLNESCKADVQCSGSKNSGMCRENTCTCNKGFIRVPVQEDCLPGNLILGQECTHDLQCTGTENGRRCLNGECFCEKGFVLERLRCLQDRIHMDGSCEAHVQCSGTTNAGVCGDNQTCTCDTGFIKIQKEVCALGNLSLGQTCTHDSQCTGTENGGRCLNNECFCDEGFVLQRLVCLPGDCDRTSEVCDYTLDRKHLGESCEAHVQCSGTANAGVCGDNQTCTCDTGFTKIEGDCTQGNLSLGQACSHDSQCTGTANSGKCLSNECFCEDSFVLNRLKCLPELVGKENQMYYVAGAGVIGTIVLYSVVLLALKGGKSGTKRFSPHNPQNEPMKNIEYSSAEGIELQCMQEAQGYSEDYYSVPIENVYSELHQKENEKDTGNIYDSSHPQHPRGDKDSDHYIYSYNHLHEKPLDMSENVYDISNPVPLSSFVPNQ